MRLSVRQNDQRIMQLYEARGWERVKAPPQDGNVSLARSWQHPRYGTVQDAMLREIAEAIIDAHEQVNLAPASITIKRLGEMFGRS